MQKYDLKWHAYQRAYHELYEGTWPQNAEEATLPTPLGNYQGTGQLSFLTCYLGSIGLEFFWFMIMGGKIDLALQVGFYSAGLLLIGFLLLILSANEEETLPPTSPTEGSGFFVSVTAKIPV